MGWLNRLANMIRPTRVSNEIDEELRYHIDARTAHNIAAGMSPEEARSYIPARRATRIHPMIALRCD